MAFKIFLRPSGMWQFGDQSGIKAGIHSVSLNSTSQTVTIQRTRNYLPIIKDEPVTSIEKDDVGGTYADIAEFENATADFFAGIIPQSGASDIGGSPTNPLFTSTPYVSESDIDWNNSIFTGWTGDPRNLLRGANTGGIYNDSVSNPKEFTLIVKRSRKSRVFGIGTETGDFSNIRVSALGSAGALRGILDVSTEDTKATSYAYGENSFEYNALFVQFFTTDRIDITNLLIKDEYSDIEPNSVHKWGENLDIDSGEEETIWPLGDKYQFTDRSSPVTYYISSSDAADTHEVEIMAVGINANGRTQEQTATFNLQGQTKLAIPLTFLCTDVNRVILRGADQLGDIYVYEDATVVGGVPQDLNLVRAFVPTGQKQTKQAVYALPEFDFIGRKIIFGKLIKYGAKVIRNANVEGIIDFLIAEDNDSGRVFRSDALSNDLESGYEWGIRTPKLISPPARLWINAKELNVNNVGITAEFHIIPKTL